MSRSSSRPFQQADWQDLDRNDDAETASPVDQRLALPLLMSQVLSSGRHARVLCDGKLAVLWSNPQFDALRQETQALRIERGAIVLNSRGQQAKLEQFVFAPASEDMVLFTGHDEQPDRYVIHVLRVRCLLNKWCFAVKIIDKTHNAADSFRHFDTHYKMTAQETNICRDLLAGDTVAAIAKRRVCSPDTIRFHVQNLYRKLDVSSREEMFARLRVFQME